MSEILQRFGAWLDSLPTVAQAGLSLLALLLLGLLADLVIRRRLVQIAGAVADRTEQQWDDVLAEHKVFARLAQTLPAIVVYFGVAYLPGLDDTLVELIRNITQAYLALVVTLAIGAALSAGNAIYETYPVSRDRPIKGFIQVTKIAIYVLGAVVVVSALLSKSPVVLLTGFGAMTAIVMLVFKDTILSLVASIQLTSMDMVRVGDWIEMPQYSADGDVIDVALHTVKVQNWDKTITTVPTHKLISESFRNWRGMSDSGGRRIKRSIHIDVSSVRFLSADEVDQFKRFALLSEYIDDKLKELKAYNDALTDALTDEGGGDVNLRRLTNLGTFRAYVFNYLRNHPDIHKEMTLLVRQLQPGPQGIPIEIYAFTNTTVWARYEAIQADIFDHLLAQCPQFGLRVYQQPAGADLQMLAGAGSSAEGRPEK